MRRTILTTALLFGALFTPLAEAQEVPEAQQAQDAEAAATEIMMLRLYDGSILWGSIAGHDAELLHFTRLDNGGLVRMPWSRLDPPLSDELLERFGYVDTSSEEVMTEADRLILNDGREIIGKIVNRTENELWIKTSNSVIPVPKMRLQGAATVVQVPALDVYTREELYQAEVTQLVPDDPVSRQELAEFCERIFDFDHALEHLEAIRTLDPELDDTELQNSVNRLLIKQQNQEQIEYLREIDHLRARGRYDDALANCAAFTELFPDSPLRQDAARKQALVEKSREKALRDRVARLWHHWSRKLARRAALDPEMTLEAVIGWIDEGLREEVVTEVHDDLSNAVSETITPDEVMKYWTEREAGRWQKASYGGGTWLLGEAEATKGLEERVDPNKPTEGERDEERKKLEVRIRRYMKNQEAVRKAKSSGGGEEEDQQKFWAGWSSTGRTQWILAYYAENSGDMELRDPPLFRNCTECGGKGVRVIINTGNARSGSAAANEQLVPCPTCRGTRVFRRLSYR
jgi:tetratricopeptide (TPR) repeat protein